MRDSSAATHKHFLTADEIAELWLEQKVSQQCATGSGHFIVEHADGPSGPFKAKDLGLAFSEGPSILTTVYGAPVGFDMPPLADANEARKDAELKKRNEPIKALLASTPSKIVRSRVKLLTPPHGCSGCVSCVPDVRLRPHRSKTQQRATIVWTPGSKPRELREQEAVMSFLKSLAAFVRRAERAHRSAAYKARKVRAAAARAQMQTRRAEQKAMRAAVRRASEVVEGQ
jgi:hypothetical protein